MDHVNRLSRRPGVGQQGDVGDGCSSDSESFVRDGGLGCVDRKQNNTAFYDPCQDFFFLENDGDPARRSWASQMHGTGQWGTVATS